MSTATQEVPVVQDAIGAITIITKVAIAAIQELTQDGASATGTVSQVAEQAVGAISGIKGAAQGVDEPNDALDEPAAKDGQGTEAPIEAEPGESGDDSSGIESEDTNKQSQMSPNDMVRAQMGGSRAVPRIGLADSPNALASAASKSTAALDDTGKTDADRVGVTVDDAVPDATGDPINEQKTIA